MNQLYDPDEATRIVRDYLCSDCWGQLTSRYQPKERKSIVTCSTEGCTQHGFIRRKSVELAESKAHGDLLEAKLALRKVVPQTLPASSAEIIKQLGF